MQQTPLTTASADSRRLNRDHAALLVVDLQERLLPSIWEHERVLREALRLIRGAAVLGLPTLATEQYRQGLGPTVTPVAQAIPNFVPVEKLAFSGCTTEVVETLRQSGARDVLLCGIEAHVCVCQTALDLLDAGWRVFVVGDACSSRTPDNCRVGLDRMRTAGATLISVEMALFELLERAGTEEFKRILALVR